MITYEDNSLALLMGNVARIRLVRRHVEDLAPIGGNLAELARSVGTITRKAAPPVGELEVADFYDALASAGIAFVLLIDGCMQADKFASFRERLGLVIGPKQDSELFVGPGSATDALRSFTDGLRHFPMASHIFPRKAQLCWELHREPSPVSKKIQRGAGPPVGPLARYIATSVSRSKLWADRPSLPRLLNWSADNQQVCEFRSIVITDSV